MFKNPIFIISFWALYQSTVCFGVITTGLRDASGSGLRRQGSVNAPSRDLLPPPALSASFPTLRPRPRPQARPAQSQPQPRPPQVPQSRPPPSPQIRPIPQQQRNPNNQLSPFQFQQQQQPQRPFPPIPSRLRPQPAPVPPQPQLQPQFQSQQIIDLLPPFQLPGSPGGSPSPPTSSTPDKKDEPALLPPIEIPPEKPLTDEEIAQLFAESSLLPTTGQGVGISTSTQSGAVKLTVVNEPIVPSPQIPSPSPVFPRRPGAQATVTVRTTPSTTTTTTTTSTTPRPPPPLPSGIRTVLPTTENIAVLLVSSSHGIQAVGNGSLVGLGGGENNSGPQLQKHFPGANIRFPDSSTAIPNTSQKFCPICDCTNEVDYICGSNGAIYLNSCAFDCATFCETGLKKAPLEFCARANQL